MNERLISRDKQGRMWQIGNPTRKGPYFDIICPHGRPVDVLNNSGEPATQEDLDTWVAEVSADYWANSCMYTCMTSVQRAALQHIDGGRPR